MVDIFKQFEGRDLAISATGGLLVMDPTSGQTTQVAPDASPGVDLTATAAELNKLHGITDAKVVSGGANVTTATFNTVSTTTVAAVPGTSIALVAGGTYVIDGHIFGSGGNAAGINVQLGTSDTLTLTSANMVGNLKNGTTGAASTNITALGSDFANFANTYTDVAFEGSLVVATAGTLILKAAQHSSSAATCTIAAGSYIRVRRV